MLRLDSGATIQLGAVIARAGEGTIYEVVGHPEWVAKIFHHDLKDLTAKRAKVAAMTASCPDGATEGDGFVVLTWPLHTVSGDAGEVGYVMPRLDTANAVEIHTLSNPSNRVNPLPSSPQWTRHVSWHHLVNIAANLCLAVETVHRVDALIGDFQERNILVNDTTRVSLVDCDSMQFTSASGHRFLCGVGRAEFTSPELAGTDLASTAREKPSDLFALAVHLHLLLMAGNHPFMRGSWTGGGDQPDALTLARSGQWAGGPGSNLHTHPLAPPVDFLPTEIKRLFERAFTSGAHDPARRPSASEWREALLRMRIGTCPRGHQIPVEADPCPWCAIDDVRAVRRSAHTGSSTPQRSMPVYEPKPPPVAPPAAVVPSGGASGTGRRNALIGLGVTVGVVAIVAALMTAFGGSEPDRTADTRNTVTGSSSRTASSATCDTLPSIGRPALSLTAGGLAVDVPLGVDCDSTVRLSGANVQVAVSDGAKDVAAGVFNLSSQPVTIDGQTTQRFVFPVGMYWRTPELTSSEVTAEITGLSHQVSSVPSTGSGAVTAQQAVAPRYGTVDSVAAAALAELSGADYPFVRSNLANRWMPQISSKRIGLVTDGITYSDPDILRDHLIRRQQYDGVRLLWSGNWSTFSGPDWWVTIVGSPSNDAATANRWCDAHNIDSWNCLAKYVSDTVGPDGTTVIRR